MFTQTWNKYLPIIKILMKRSATGPQTLDMNQTDFQRAAGGRKVKFTFAVTLHKGRIQNLTSPPPLARELSLILQEDDMTRQLVRQQDYEFSLNSGFQLTIKNNALPASETTTEPETDTSEENNKENNTAAV
ncbi:MAG TPA: hypothetical protein VKC90_04090 [Chitinophagaceae bacterium]|nr:hypothetical protein [Chitinophagaceae bacterium]